MGKITRIDVPINMVAGWMRHFGLVVLGVAAAMLIVYSPAPLIGLIVLTIVLGVELPTAVWNFLGVRAA